MKNNVAIRLLETTLNQFPPGTADFVTYKVLKDYIQDTSIKTRVNDITQYDTEVKEIRKKGKKWMKFDAVVVASGHYHTPKVPNTPRLAAWKHNWPDRIQHSKSYRKPDAFYDKNVLLIGGAVSATDIARELGPVAKTNFQSQRQGTIDLPASLLPENAKRVGKVESYDAVPVKDTLEPLDVNDALPGTITLKSGQRLCNTHHIILCTGYYITLPFLSHLHPPSIPVHRANDSVLIADGSQFHNLHKDIFYIPDPSLTFLGVPFFTATSTLFEFQAMVVAKVLAGQAKLPSMQAMLEEYEEVEREGYGKGFHSLKRVGNREGR